MSLSIYKFLEVLEKHNIPYEMYSAKQDIIAVQVAIPGEIWKFRFQSSGSMSMQQFKSTGEIQGEEKLSDFTERIGCKAENSMYSLIDALRLKDITFTLAQNREGEVAVKVNVILEDEHWEIEFFESDAAGDGDAIQIEIFKSNGELFGDEKIAELISIFER
jgi:hypothetical protein